MITRKIYSSISNSLNNYPAVAVLGGRQIGKTTLVKIIQSQFKNAHYLDLELPSDLEKLSDPELYLSKLSDSLIIIDEAQRKPELFPVLRALIDQKRTPGRFLLTCSASPNLIQKSSESLAGRIKYHELGGLSIEEMEEVATLEEHWFDGGYPLGLLQAKEIREDWKNSFIQSYLEREILQFHLNVMPVEMRKFWTLIAHSHGTVQNVSNLSQSMGITNVTIKRYLQFLEGTYMVRSLPPWFVNVKKRLVKSPKIYIRDSGILHTLLGISNYESLINHSIVGSSWEGYVIEQLHLCKSNNLSLYFWRSQVGAEIDIVIVKSGAVVGVLEIKYSLSPKLERGFYEARKDLGNPFAWVIYPGDDKYLLKEDICVCSLRKFISEVLVNF